MQLENIFNNPSGKVMCHQGDTHQVCALSSYQKATAPVNVFTNIKYSFG